MGSGSLAAMSVFETKYREDLTRDEAIALATEAIEAGIYNDLGSGSNVDIMVIDQNGKDYKRSHRFYSKKAYESGIEYKFPAGTAEVLRNYELVVNDAMDLD